MAQTIPCDLCNEEPARYLVTVQGDGRTFGVGDECTPAWGMLIAGVPPERIPDAIEAYLPAPVELVDENTPADGDVGLGQLAGPPAGDSADVPHVGALEVPPPAEPASTSEPAQRARTRRRLAERPDSARSSADAAARES